MVGWWETFFNLVARGQFLEGPEKFSHLESHNNLKPYDYKAVLSRTHS